MQKIKLHVKVTPEHLEALDNLAKEENRSRSNMVDMLVGEALQARIAGVNNRINELKEEISNGNTAIIEFYEREISNLEWHLKTNGTFIDEEKKEHIQTRINDRKEFINKLKEV